MTNIVERLRSRLKAMDAYYDLEEIMRVFAEAADEIERLRATLAEETAWARQTDHALAKAEVEIEWLRDALWQAVDDFSEGHCVCEQTKQQCIAVLAAIEQK